MAIPNNYGDNYNPQNENKEDRLADGQALVSWVMSRVEHARDQRDNDHEARWQEYTRLWRGFWKETDKNTNSERSKLVAPALQQAIEMTAAEVEEAIFSKKAWFEIDDDIADEDKEDVIAYRDQLLEDFELDDIPQNLSEIFLMGSLYGTGIGKLNVFPKRERVMQNGEPVMTNRISVQLEAIRPDQFVIDPAARTLGEAMFCAHEPVKPLDAIREKINDGFYNDVELGPYTGTILASPTGTEEHSYNAEDEACLITEYYGKVPAEMLPNSDKTGMVEAIVTVANENTLLKAVENPFDMKDRPIVAYQHEKVPGEFWGRGVAEKGFNPQKALDAELRARIDTLALVTSPMMGADITRLPRNPDMRIRPGKMWLTRGRPSEILEPIGLSPQGLALTFQQGSDMERMVQMGTGAMDTASPLSTNRRNETASGMSMMQTGFIKRAKRTMQNIERQLMEPLIRKALWRYMQFDPDRYPTDFKFKVSSGMGVMAKELEQQQLINLLGFVPAESQAHMIILGAIFDNTPSANKAELKAAMDALVQAAQPTPEQQQLQQAQQQLAMRQAEAEVAKTEAEAMREQAEAELSRAKAERERILADLEDDKVQLQASEVAVSAERTRAQMAQTEIARERNAIERQKVNRGSKESK